MDVGLQSFVVFLSILWFFVYWILGGVFFAVMAILRLGRVRKVRFSCLFSLLAAFCAVGAAYGGVQYAATSIRTCVVEATQGIQIKVAVIGCGFSGIMGAFVVGVVILLFGGFIILSLSKSKTRPWIVLDQEGEEEEETDKITLKKDLVPVRKSKFF